MLSNGEIEEALQQIDKDVDELYEEGYTWEEGCDFFRDRFEQVYGFTMILLEKSNQNIIEN